MANFWGPIGAFIRKINPVINLGAEAYVLNRQHAPIPTNLSQQFWAISPTSSGGFQGLLTQPGQAVNHTPIARGFPINPTNFRGGLGYFEGE